MTKKTLLCLAVFLAAAGVSFGAEKADYLEWARSAKGGDVGKQYLTGLAYYKGIGGAPRNYRKAYEWFNYAAKNGSAPALVSLGDMYLFGHLASADEKKAFDYYLKAARMWDSEAMERLGDLYLDSKSLGNNYFEAAKWYEKAARETSVPGPCSKLARIYYLGGEHFDRNEKKALEYFLKAFELGDYDVAHYIAGIYEDRGEYGKAAVWLKKGAENGSTIAMYYLAKAYGGLRDYADKRILKRDYVQSYKWLHLLVRKEYQKRYEEDMRTLEGKMNKYEVRKAKKYAAALEKQLVSEAEIKWSKCSKSNPSEKK